MTAEFGSSSTFDSAATAKSAADENFPVGSWMLPRRYRWHIAVFYAFARAADDVADDVRLPSAEKLRRLDAFEAGLAGAVGANIPAAAVAMRSSLYETGVSDDHCRRLLRAFRQDVAVTRYSDWAALMAYCSLSAAPVGRYLLELHGETVRSPAVPASNALCAALQVLNHLQDCRRDLAQLDRVYIPQDMLQCHGAHERDIAAAGASPALRAALDAVLLSTERLLDEARDLPRTVASRRLAAESATILCLARRLLDRLRRNDPLAGPVRLRKRDFLAAACVGLSRAVARRADPGGAEARKA